MRCFYHPDYFLPLPAGHPFPMEKFPVLLLEVSSSHVLLLPNLPETLS